jgi:hypothetical protein
MMMRIGSSQEESMSRNTARRWLLWIASIITLTASSLVAIAAPPETGWWWNADQSGRGYQIEVQDQYIMISAYAYDPDGEAVFFTAAGALTNENFFSGTILRTSNGQCFTCPYKKPVETPVGTVMINFTSPWTADMTFLGEFIKIKRFAPAEYLALVPDVMFGEWATIDGDPEYGYFSGNRMTFNGVSYGADGTRYIAGYNTGDTDRVALASWNPSTQRITVLLDTSTSFYEIWSFKYIGFNRLEGEWDIYSKGDSPSYWSPSLATRLNFKNGVKWGLSAKAPAQTAARAAAAAGRDESNRMRATTAQRSFARPVTAEEMQIIRALEAQLAVRRAMTPKNAGMQ